MPLSISINRLLTPVGLRLERIPSPLPLTQAPARSAGHQIELIGSTGVGKSYLYMSLATQLKGSWISRYQLRKHADHERELFKELENKDSTLLKYLLSKKHEAIYNKNIPLWRKYKLYKYQVRILGADAFARECCLPTLGAFLDEGVQHNFTRELIDWHIHYAIHNRDDMQRLENFMKGRSLIFMDASVEHIMSNLKKRHLNVMGKEHNDWFAWMRESEVMKKIIDKKEINLLWLEVAASLGVPTIKIDAAEDVSVNKDKVLDFLESIQQGK